MSEQHPNTVAGEIISCSQDGATVRLDDGRLGLIPAGSPSETTWRVGLRGMFRVEAADAADHLTLAWSGADSRHAFDQEFDRLHHALKNHHPTSVRQTPSHDPLEEERLVQWVAEVDETLVRLRKRRAARLNEQI